MIYTEKNQTNTYTVRIHNTNGLLAGPFKIRLRNTVTGEIFESVFTMEIVQPYYKGVFTVDMPDGEYEYDLLHEDSLTSTITWLESGILRQGDFSDGRAVIGEEGDVVYGG